MPGRIQRAEVEVQARPTYWADDGPGPKFIMPGSCLGRALLGCVLAPWASGRLANYTAALLGKARIRGGSGLWTVVRRRGAVEPWRPRSEVLTSFQTISHSKNFGESKFFKFDQIYITR